MLDTPSLSMHIHVHACVHAGVFMHTLDYISACAYTFTFTCACVDSAEVVLASEGCKNSIKSYQKLFA